MDKAAFIILCVAVLTGTVRHPTQPWPGYVSMALALIALLLAVVPGFMR